MTKLQRPTLGVAIAYGNINIEIKNIVKQYNICTIEVMRINSKRK